MVSFDLAASQLDQRDSDQSVVVAAGATTVASAVSDSQPIELTAVSNGAKYQAKSSLDLSLSSPRSPPRSPRLSKSPPPPPPTAFTPRSMGSANAGTPAAAAAAFFPTTPPSATAMMDSFSEFHSDAPSADHGSDQHHHHSAEGGSASSATAVPYTRQQTYKDRRKNYRREKKKLADELISAIQDPTIVVMSDWLKVRTTLKQWNKYWCELRPGSLYLYKNQKTHKSSNWIGSVMLKMCELIERPSKKNGFCFKLFHPLEHPIWSPKGPHGEAFTSIMFPLPASSIIFRAPSEGSGRKWMEAIELSFKYSNMIIPAKYHSPSIQRSIEMSSSVPTTPLSATSAAASAAVNGGAVSSSPLVNSSLLLSELGGSIDKSDEDLLGSQRRALMVADGMLPFNDSEIEKHFDLCDDVHTDHGDQEDSQEHHTTEDSDDDSYFEDEEDGGGGHHHHIVRGGSAMRVLHGENGAKEVVMDLVETTYGFDGGLEEFGLVGDAGQTEDVPEENKSLLWTLLKQVRPGMDLSKVVLPTFILEPRSFLEKLADYYYHCDIISKAALEEDPLLRMKLILKWYLSGFYKKPKGLKKPYNPILGETFRCCWQHPETDSKTFYIAEQVSHHPPVSAFYVTNRKDGFCISGSILAKSKFYGNSISAILEGTAKLSLLARGEDYLITFPYAHCKGIFLGPLAFELGGKVMITCAKTGYKTELEFKLKPFFGSDDQCNLVVGKLRLGSETLGTIEGHWDSEIWYKDKRGNKGEAELFWSGVDPKVKQSRLRRHVVPLEEQSETESERLWSKVTAAINAQNQEAATVEKTALEEAQREAVKQRATRMEVWSPNLFVFDSASSDWSYKLAEMRPWDNRTDIKQYEHNYVIRTLTRHLTAKKTASSSPSLYTASSAAVAGNVIDGAVNGGESVAARNRVRYRRQMTCADPTAHKARGEGEGAAVAAAAAAAAEDHLGGPTLVGQRSLKISVGTKSTSGRQEGENQSSLSSQLSTLKGALCSLEQKYETMRSEVNHHLHSCRCSSSAAGPGGDALSSGTSSTTTAATGYHYQNVRMSSSSSGTFGITRLRFQSLLSIVPAEVRQVLFVLIAHLLLLTFYPSIFTASTSSSSTSSTSSSSLSSNNAGQLPSASVSDSSSTSSTS